MWGALIAGVVAAIGGLIAANQQETSNEHLAKFQADANQKYLDAQNQYNAPKSQMQRFQEAGLNPHLIYGQGNPGNQSTPLSYPDVKPVDRQRAIEGFSQIMPLLNQTRLTEAQVNAQNANTLKRTADTKLVELQTLVLSKNPALDDAGYKAMIDGLKATAMLKEGQAEGQKLSNMFQESTVGTRGSKILAEWRLLEQRFRLGEIDLQIKAEVLKSKEFQNAISEVQKKFLADGDIGPQQIYQFILLLLTKSL